MVAPRQTITPQRTQVVAKRPRVRTPHKSVALDATPLQLQELEAAAAANPQAPPSKRLAAARKRYAKTAGAKDAVDISGRSAARDVEVNQINRARLAANLAQVIRNRIDPNNTPLDPSRLPPRRAQSGEPEAEDDLIPDLMRALEAWEVGVPDPDEDLSDVVASSGGPVLAAAAADAVAQSSAAAAPATAQRSSAAKRQGHPYPYPPSLPKPPQRTQRFDIASDGEEDSSSFGSGGARRASAVKALAQLLLHRSRK